MSNEEANKVLEELHEVRPEKLNGKAKRLFEAIMKIADARDKAESDLYEANNRINDLLDLVKDKDKIIKLMAEELNDFYDDIAIEYRKRTIEDTIKKFEERCK